MPSTRKAPTRKSVAAKKTPATKPQRARKKERDLLAEVFPTPIATEYVASPQRIKALEKSDLSVSMMPILSIKPYGKNPRIIPDSAVEKVARSITEFGWQQPIVVDEHMVIIVGHTRYMAAAKLGLQFIPVHVAKGLTKAQVRAYRLADNRVGAETAWDSEKLLEEFSDLQMDDFDLALTGFDPYEFNQGKGIDAHAEWKEMPEFEHEDQTAYRTISLHFKDEKAVEDFTKLVKQRLTPQTKYLWFPKQPIEVMKKGAREYANRS